MLNWKSPIVHLFFLMMIAVAAAVSPRIFLETLRYAPIGGTYSVIPVINDHMLDFSFHVDRLCSGFEILSKSSIDYSTFHVRALNAIREAKVTANSPLKSTKSSAIVTIAMYKDVENDAISMSALYTSVNISTYISTSLLPQAVADVHYFRRKLPNVKDIRWPKDRKIVESRRKNINVDESLLLRKNFDLCTDAFTEGLVSNLFVIDESYNVITCPSSFVLPGCMSKIVRKICYEHGISVIERPPLLSDLPNWKSAFIVSCCKPVWILKGLYLPSISAQTDEDGRFYCSLLKRYDKRSKDIMVIIKQNLSKIFLNAAEGRYLQGMYGTTWDPIETVSLC